MEINKNDTAVIFIDPQNKADLGRVEQMLHTDVEEP